MKRQFVGLLSVGVVSLAACGDEASGVRCVDGSGNFLGTAATAELCSSLGTPDVVEDVAVEDTAPTEEVAEEISEPECEYPEYDVILDRGAIIPPYRWAAKKSDGTDLVFDLKEVYCKTNPEFAKYDTILFEISTLWCPNCPAFIQYVDALGAQLEENNSLVLFLEVENDYGEEVGTEEAAERLLEHTPNGTGIRAGDADNLEDPDSIRRSGIVEYYPTSFVVRTSDMQVIADARDSDYFLPFVEIAMDPNADWSSPGIPTIQPEFPTNCGEESEESYEPNDTEQSASIIGATTFEGGICNYQADYYDIDIEGRWSVFLEFDNSVGDLDLYLWDTEKHDRATDENRRLIGSQGDNESEYFEWQGRSHIYITGFQGSTVPYRMTVQSLGE